MRGGNLWGWLSLGPAGSPCRAVKDSICFAVVERVPWPRGVGSRLESCGLDDGGLSPMHACCCCCQLQNENEEVRQAELMPAVSVLTMCLH